MRKLTSLIGIAFVLLTFSILQDAMAQQGILKLRLSPELVRLNAKGEADLSIEATNVSNKPITLTLRPEKSQNLTLTVFENGQFLNEVVGDKLIVPNMESIGGVQPGFPYQRDETLTLSPGKSTTFKMLLTTAPSDHKSMDTGNIYIDGPSPWGKSLNRELWSLPFKSNKIRVRFVYKHNGMTASSNDAVVQK